jgi:hypothetical protein
MNWLPKLKLKSLNKEPKSKLPEKKPLDLPRNKLLLLRLNRRDWKLRKKLPLLLLRKQTKMLLLLMH